MTYTILRQYRHLAGLYGWPESLAGAAAFARQMRLGLRDKWAARKEAPADVHIIC